MSFDLYLALLIDDMVASCECYGDISDVVLSLSEFDAHTTTIH